MSKPMPISHDLPGSSKMTDPIRIFRIERQLGEQWQIIELVHDASHGMARLAHWASALPMERHRLTSYVILHDTHDPRHNA